MEGANWFLFNAIGGNPKHLDDAHGSRHACRQKKAQQTYSVMETLDENNKNLYFSIQKKYEENTFLLFILDL